MTANQIAELTARLTYGARQLEAEADTAACGGDPDRAQRKLAAAATVREYAGKLGADTDYDQAEMVADAAALSGILIEPRQFEISDSFLALWTPDQHATVEERRATMRALAEQGTFVRVADPGQVVFYALAGYHN
jgi:hypothetical protein